MCDILVYSISVPAWSGAVVLPVNMPFGGIFGGMCKNCKPTKLIYPGLYTFYSIAVLGNQFWLWKKKSSKSILGPERFNSGNLPKRDILTKTWAPIPEPWTQIQDTRICQNRIEQTAMGCWFFLGWLLLGCILGCISCWPMCIWDQFRHF